MRVRFKQFGNINLFVSKTKQHFISRINCWQRLIIKYGNRERGQGLEHFGFDQFENRSKWWRGLVVSPSCNITREVARGKQEGREKEDKHNTKRKVARKPNMQFYQKPKGDMVRCMNAT